MSPVPPVGTPSSPAEWRANLRKSDSVGGGGSVSGDGVGVSGGGVTKEQSTTDKLPQSTSPSVVNKPADTSVCHRM